MSFIFIRHADLEYPYDSYDTLSLRQLDALATDKIQPHINGKLAAAKIKHHLEHGFLNKGSIDVIYHSPSLRSRETAELLATQLGVNEVHELKCLQEIAFSPKKLVSEKKFQEAGMNAVREAVYKAVAHGQTNESSAELIARIQELQSLILDNNGRSILIVTHGFFMRLLQIALKNNKLTFSVSEQRQAVNCDYLQGFTHKLGEKQ